MYDTKCFSIVLNGLVRYRVVQIPIGPFQYNTESLSMISVVQIPIGPFQYDTENLSTIQGRTNSHWSITDNTEQLQTKSFINVIVSLQKSQYSRQRSATG